MSSSDAESFVICFEDFGGRVLHRLKFLVAAPLAERAVLSALDEEEPIEAVVAAAFPAFGDVLLAHGAVAVHASRLLVVSSVEEHDQY